MEEQGIMSLGGMGAPAPVNQKPLFDPASSAAFEAARQQINPREFGDELLSAAEDTDPAAVQEFKNALQRMQLPPEVIDALGDMVDAILSEPENYQEMRAEFIKEGVPEELLPPQFDAAYFGAMNMALDQMSGSAQPMPVQAFANGGIVALNPIAQILADQGMGSDRMLAHITPAEARLLRRRGGAGTINPATGLPQYLRKAFKSVAKAVGNTFKNVGKAISNTVKNIGGAIKKFASSTVGKVVTAVALGFFLGPAAASMLGVTSAAGVAAVSGFVGGFGSTVLAGGSLKDALKSGAMGGLTAGVTAGVTGGMNAFEAGSYAGPTTVSGQWDRAVESGKSLLGMPSAQPEVVGTLPANAELTGQNVGVSPVQAPTAPTVTEIAGQNIPGPNDFMFDPATGDLLAPPTPLTAPPPAITPASASFTLPTNNAFSFDPVTGEMITAPAAIGPGTGATSFAPINTQPYPLTSDAQNLIAAGQGVPTPAASGDLGGGLNIDRLSRVPGLDPNRGYDSFMSPTRDGIGSLSGAPRAAATGFQQAPSAMDLFKQGEYWQGTKELFSPTSYTNQQLIQSPQYQQYVQAGFKPTEALKMASSDLNPGMLRTYGPTAAAGVAALGAMGGFTAQEPGAPGIVPQETGFDLLARSPEIYGTTPGGAATQYFTPQYMGYGLPTQQYRPAQYNFAPIQYAAYQRPRMYAEGGIAALKTGGTAKFPRKNGAINGPGTGTSDDIPAMLSDGEFVFTAKAVRGMGKGSRRLGAKRMYTMMKALEGKA